MVAFIDTMFNPLMSWFQNLLDILTNASMPSGAVINLGGLFNTLTFLSPAWALLVTNVVILSAVYLITFITMNGIGAASEFKNLVQWW